MSAESDTEKRTGFGTNSAVGWPIGGALGGVVGAGAFGHVMWLLDPQILEAAVPALYGIEPAGVAGWAIHLAHGAALGVLFGFLVTRDVVLGALRADDETTALSAASLDLRVVGAGFAYGLAVWAILPVLVLPLWTDVTGGSTNEFPAIAVGSMIGHALFGVLLGAVFVATVDLHRRSPGDTLEE